MATIGGTETPIDWRFNEFPNAGAHVLYTTCVELMALSVGPAAVTNGLLDVVARGYTAIPANQIHQWINAVGLIMAALPLSYWNVLLERLVTTISDVASWDGEIDVFKIFNFKEANMAQYDSKYSYLIALTHSVWHHAGPGQIASIPPWIKDSLSTVIQTEPQFLFLCHLVGPFLQRFNMALMVSILYYIAYSVSPINILLTKNV